MTRKFLISQSPEMTRKIAKKIAKTLCPGDILTLNGNLGSGKTVFVQGLAKGLGLNPRIVRSPSFALIQEYRGNLSLCHADLYRLSFDEISNLGLEEYWKSGNWIIAIEWADKAGKIIPSVALGIRFKMISKNIREITFAGNKKWQKILKQLSKQKKF